jgi:uncharacterized protein
MPTDIALPSSISTYSGPLFDYDHPEIRIEDVAHGLSNACRFGNQASRFYSVAEHSMLVAALVQVNHPELVLPALWHDAHEAYVGDIPTPLKKMLGSKYRDITARIDLAVAGYLGIDVELFHAVAVREADQTAMLYEARELQPHSDAWAFTRDQPHYEAERAYGPLHCLLPEVAEAAFLQLNEVLGVYASR